MLLLLMQSRSLKHNMQSKVSGSSAFAPTTEASISRIMQLNNVPAKGLSRNFQVVKHISRMAKLNALAGVPKIGPTAWWLVPTLLASMMMNQRTKGYPMVGRRCCRVGRVFALACNGECIFHTGCTLDCGDSILSKFSTYWSYGMCAIWGQQRNLHVWIQSTHQNQNECSNVQRPYDLNCPNVVQMGVQLV